MDEPITDIDFHPLAQSVCNSGKGICSFFTEK